MDCFNPAHDKTKKYVKIIQAVSFSLRFPFPFPAWPALLEGGQAIQRMDSVVCFVNTYALVSHLSVNSVIYLVTRFCKFNLTAPFLT